MNKGVTTLTTFTTLITFTTTFLYAQMEMVSTESDHFILKTTPRDQFLSQYALDALEKAYQEIGNDLQVFPKEKIPVEIYPSQESFSKASTLTKEILDRSGAIGICKFGKLMILSPEQTAYGYRWLDTLSHEYTHYVINILSAERCPLWLHEGIAKYFETRWRLQEPCFLTPGNRTELVRTLKEDKLITFSRMEPSMVYLENQTQVRLAFSQVTHAVHFIVKTHGLGTVHQILNELSKNQTREQAFQTVLNLSPLEFEKNWHVFLKQENLEESPGAVPDIIQFNRQSNELEDLVGLDLQAHIRLGDRMRQSSRPDMALIQYQKALEKESNNPVALTKMARSLILLGKTEEAIQTLEKAIAENPNYGTAFMLLGHLMIQKQNWQKALTYYREANAINPYNPETHQKLVQIYKELGETKLAESESLIYNALTSPISP